MGASISTWAQWEGSAAQDGQQQETTVIQPPAFATETERDDNQGASDQTEDDAGAQTQGEPFVQHPEAEPVEQGASTIVHNSGPSLFQGAQNLTFYGGSYTMIVQQAGLDVDRRYLREVLDFFSLVNFRSIQEENLAKWTDGTLKAFIEGNMFQLWLVTQYAIIWGTGMPGAGKTILASVVNKHLDALAGAANDICFAFVYCRYTEPMAVRDILAALVRQLLERYPHLLSIIEPMYKKRDLERTKPSQLELIGLIRHICSLFRVSFFSIDGLDEALYDEQFDLLETLSSIKANFIITSRPLVRLEDALPNAQFFEVTAQEGDIELLVAQHINRSPDIHQILNSEEGRKRVIKKICESSQGMFLHASLMVEAVRGCTSLGSVMKRLGKLPSKLDVLYDEAFRRIEAQGEERASLAKRVLMWVVYAFCPISVVDLQYAVASDPHADWEDKANLVPESLMVSVCCGLITVEDRYGPSSPTTVRLVHYTALEALKRLLGPYEVSPHCHLAETCIERLLYCGIPSGGAFAIPEMSTSGHSRPIRRALVPYAYEWWHVHARDAIPDPAQPDARPVPFILQFLRSSTSYPAIAKGPAGGTFTFDVLTLPIHLITFCHLPSILPLVDPLVNETTRWGRSALSIAAYQDDIAIAEHLLKLGGISVNLQDDEGNTALMLAAERGNANMVALLLRDPRVDIHKRNNYQETALHCALAGEKYQEPLSRGPTQSTLRLIATPGIDVNVVDKKGRSPLMRAHHHPLQLLDALIQHPDINLHIRDDDGLTPLMHACRRGSSSAMRWYLQLPGVLARDNKGATALFHRAHHEFHTDLLSDFRALIDAGLHVNDKDGRGFTALADCVFSRHSNLREKALRALLQLEEVDISIRDPTGLTLLMSACSQSWRNPAILDLLCSVPGAAFNARDDAGRTALMHVFLPTGYGFVLEDFTKDLAVTLLKYPEVDINVKDEHGMTALGYAIVAGAFHTAESLILSFEAGRVRRVFRECRDGRERIALYETSNDDTPFLEVFKGSEIAVQLHVEEQSRPGMHSTINVVGKLSGSHDGGRALSASPWRPHRVHNWSSKINDGFEGALTEMGTFGLGFPWDNPWIGGKSVDYVQPLLDHPNIDDCGLGFLRDITMEVKDPSEGS